MLFGSRRTYPLLSKPSRAGLPDPTHAFNFYRCFYYGLAGYKQRHVHANQRPPSHLDWKVTNQRAEDRVRIIVAAQGSELQVLHVCAYFSHTAIQMAVHASSSASSRAVRHTAPIGARSMPQEKALCVEA